jgi:hypothetical protein
MMATPKKTTVPDLRSGITVTRSGRPSRSPKRYENCLGACVTGRPLPSIVRPPRRIASARTNSQTTVLTSTEQRSLPPSNNGPHLHRTTVLTSIKQRPSPPSNNDLFTPPSSVLLLCRTTPFDFTPRTCEVMKSSSATTMRLWRY